MPFGFELPSFVMGFEDYFMLSFGLNLALSVGFLIIFIFAGRPLLVFLKAKLMGRTILLIGRKDRRAVLMTAKYEGGIQRTRKYGDYVHVPNATLLCHGTTLGLAFEGYGVTLPPYLIKDVENLRNYGVKSYEEIEKLRPEIEKLASTNPNPTSKHYQGLLSSMDNVQNFFKYNINPHTLRATINRSVAEIMKEYRSFDIMKWAFGIGILIFLILLGWSIYQSTLPTAATTGPAAVGGAVGEGAKIVGAGIQ